MGKAMRDVGPALRGARGRYLQSITFDDFGDDVLGTCRSLAALGARCSARRRTSGST